LLSPICSSGAAVDRYPACGARWYVNVHDPFIASSFHYRIGQAVSHFYPLPDFVYLDNAEYDFPSEDQCVPYVPGTDPFNADTRTSNCVQGNNSSVGTDHRSYFVYREGSPVNFSDVISHTSSTLRLLNELNIRGMINVHFEPWWLQTYYEKRQPDGVNNSYPIQFLSALIQQYVNQTPTDPGHTVANGLSVEQSFRVPYRFSAARTAYEMQQYREWLNNGIPIVLVNYDAEGRWDAAMVMMMRDPGQSAFVSRDDNNALDDPLRKFVALDGNGVLINSLPWPKWPSLYGTRTSSAVFHAGCNSPGRDPDYWESFYMKRTFSTGKSLYAVHALADRTTPGAGCSANGSVNLATLLQADIPTFKQLKYSNPAKGTFDGACYTATALPNPPPPPPAPPPPDYDTDYFTLASADCASNSTGACTTDVEVAIGITLKANPHVDPKGPRPDGTCP
jgi:hypothetical protein